MNKIIIKKKLKESLIKNLYDYEMKVCDKLKDNVIEILQSYFIVNEKSTQIKFEKDEKNNISFCLKIIIDRIC